MSMCGLAALEQKLREQLLSENHRVLDLAATILARGTNCTYAIWNPIYIEARLNKRRLGFYSVSQAWYWADRRVQKARMAMYEAPCKQCPTCLRRRKPWPLNLKALPKQKP